MSETAVATYSNEQITLIRDTVAKGSTETELKMFLYQASRTGLDPLSKQIHAIKRWNSSLQREEMTIQTGIDGFRLIAQRTGDVDGQEGPFWCGENGVWLDVWVSTKPPAAAKVIVYRQGCSRPFVGIAHFAEYVQTKKDGTATAFWVRMPAGQLAKCAEVIALRKAFPAELSGIYSHEEMQQADSGKPEPPKESKKPETRAPQEKKPPKPEAAEPPKRTVSSVVNALCAAYDGEFDAINAIPRRQALLLVYPPPERLEFVPLLNKRMDNLLPRLMVYAAIVGMIAVIGYQIMHAKGW
jgi:phage recombination protein Bet